MSFDPWNVSYSIGCKDGIVIDNSLGTKKVRILSLDQVCRIETGSTTNNGFPIQWRERLNVQVQSCNDTFGSCHPIENKFTILVNWKFIERNGV